MFDFTKVQGPALAGGVNACEGGASRIAGSGVEVTSLRMQNMCSGVTVGLRMVESGGGEKGPTASDGQMAMTGGNLETRGDGRSMCVGCVA